MAAGGQVAGSDRTLEALGAYQPGRPDRGKPRGMEACTGRALDSSTLVAFKGKPIVPCLHKD
jgi:hypothetical protein